MTVFSSARAFQTVLEEVLDGAQDTAAARALTESGLRVGFAYHDPELVMLLSAVPGQISAAFSDHPTSAAADVTFSSSADTGHRFWMGELSVPTALALGQIRAVGRLTQALALLPLMPELQARYRAAYETRQEGGT
ncbi:hypothetical protein [Deinococcus koreensis]|uniref:SCP2 domain-containing protein n=1 Tax=Deinococcus koreensis TaxID=2054903 RepID=A0A2K3UT98_9DEIO|nr:hypothetical protein [Deinococcus koreensis]PNY79756.1 hypothetical protein CVO96_17540 [Deinococcus koreensis]